MHADASEGVAWVECTNWIEDDRVFTTTLDFNIHQKLISSLDGNQRISSTLHHFYLRALRFSTRESTWSRSFTCSNSSSCFLFVSRRMCSRSWMLNTFGSMPTFSQPVFHPAVPLVWLRIKRVAPVATEIERLFNQKGTRRTWRIVVGCSSCLWIQHKNEAESNLSTSNTQGLEG